MSEFVFWFAAAPVFLFPIVYAVTAPWWRTDAGRQSMALSLMLVLLFTIGILNRTVGMEHAATQVSRGAAFIAVAVVVWWRLILLIRVQILARARRQSLGRGNGRR